MAMIEYLTDAGREMLSQMIAGEKTISYTKIQMGDGVITTSHDKRTMTSLINPIVTLDVESVSVTTENVIKITGVFSNESLTSGFYYREKAIFASDGENEILFSYANAGSESEWIEPPTVEIIEKKIMSLYKEFQDTETDLKIQIKSGIYVSTDDFNTALNELEGKYAKKDLYDDTTINVGRKAGTEIGSNSTAEGYSTTASGYCSHAEGYSTTASGFYSHAEGYMTTAEANSHAEGFTTTASGDCSHAEGYGTTASGEYSHAEGDRTTASGYYSHAEGQGTNASSYLQHVQGKYNIEDTESKYVHIVGNGTSETERSNAHTVDWEGNAWYSGDVCNGNGVSLDGLNTNLDGLEFGELSATSNIFGGKELVKAMVATGSDTVSVYGNNVTYKHNSNYQNKDIIFDKFEKNTQYTFMIYGHSLSSSLITNLAVEYTDGTITYIEWSNTSKSDHIITFVSTAGKTVKCFKYSFADIKRSIINTSKCGVFKGVLSEENFIEQIPSVKMLADENSQKSIEAMDLKMLGWNVPKECPIQNYVDSDGVFHQRVGRVDLGTLDWSYSSEYKRFSTSGITDYKKKDSGSNTWVADAFLKGYSTTSGNNTASDSYNKSIGFNGTSNMFFVKNTSYTDTTTFKNAMQGQYLYYELATEISMNVDGNEVTERINERFLSVLGKCKNLLNTTLTTTTSSGVTCTDNGDGTYNIVGTNNTSSNAIFICDVVINGTGQGKLLGVPKGSSGITLQTNYDGSWGQSLYWDTGNGAVLPNIEKVQRLAILVNPGTTVNHTIKPMITTDLNATYDDYEPYTGNGKDLMHDVAEIKNDLDNKCSYEGNTVKSGLEGSGVTGNLDAMRYKLSDKIYLVDIQFIITSISSSISSGNGPSIDLTLEDLGFSSEETVARTSSCILTSYYPLIVNGSTGYCLGGGMCSVEEKEKSVYFRFLPHINTKGSISDTNKSVLNGTIMIKLK